MVYPVWPWPVIKSTAGVNREYAIEKDTEQPQQTEYYVIVNKKRGTNHGYKQRVGKRRVTPPKRGSFLPNYLDQMRSRGFGTLDRRGEQVIWEMFKENDCNTFTDLKGKG